MNVWALPRWDRGNIHRSVSESRIWAFPCPTGAPGPAAPRPSRGASPDVPSATSGGPATRRRALQRPPSLKRAPTTAAVRFSQRLKLRPRRPMKEGYGFIKREIEGDSVFG